jgi:exopolysaccharide biosynthesis polyprenyl glycosylphosphotransferase
MSVEVKEDTLDRAAPSLALVTRRDGALRDTDLQPSVRRRDALNRRLLAAADLLAGAIALGGAIGLAGDALKPAAILTLPLLVLLGKVLGLYDRDEMLLRRTTLDEAPRLFQLATLWTLLVWIAAPLLVTGGLPKGQLLALGGAVFLATLVLRTAARSIARAASPPERCLVLGNEGRARRLGAKLRRTRGVKAEVVGTLPLPAGLAPDGDGTATIAHLGAIVESGAIDRVILLSGRLGPDDLVEVARTLKSLGVKVSVVPGVMEVVGAAVQLDDLGGVAMLELRRFGLTRSSAALKRAIDLAGAVVGLVVLAPLMALIALAIRLDSPGPVLFAQERVGRGGGRFRMLKFRTMVPGADGAKAALRPLNEAEGLFKIADDPRLTRIGRVLRRFSADELPQLYNVLRGEMSLVGPRPLVPDEDVRIDGWDRRRLDLAPGMTGKWQIGGASRIPLGEMVTIDYLYVANWSPWEDAKVLLRTLPYVLAGRGL